jgi:ABC-type dipeptide/oligopeptide/nickel transport system permease subunit
VSDDLGRDVFTRVLHGGRVSRLARHIWPNVARIVAAQFAVAISVAIFTCASLSFLGPGGAVSLTIFGFYAIGRTVD